MAQARADAESSGTARRADVADLVALMAALGCRIEEALSVPGGGVDLHTARVHVPGNAPRALRRVLDGAEHPWALPHTFRRTVATLLDLRGVPLTQIADYLGHADPAMTVRICLGRRLDTSPAASKL